jgi:hypothetical protein
MEAQILSLMTHHFFTGTPAATPPTQFAIRTPKLLHFDAPTTTQIHSYIPHTTTLKSYCLTNLASPTSPRHKTLCHQLGRALGRWLNAFTVWTAAHPEARETAKGNVSAQPIKHMVSYGWFEERVRELPEVLGEARDVLEEVERMERQDLAEEGKLRVVHGDLSTGK